jgi:hypothetical protein
MVHSIFGYIPNLVIALLVLTIGGILARVFAHVLTLVLHHIKFDDLVKTLGIGKALQGGGVKTGLSGIIGLITHWVLMLGVLASALNVLGVGIAGNLLNHLLLYLPGVLAAMFVLVIGIVVAKFFTTLITVVAKAVNFEEIAIVNTVVKYAIVVFAMVLALEQLSISRIVINEMLMLLFGAVCLGFAIAYGIRRGIAGKDFDLTKLINF